MRVAAASYTSRSLKVSNDFTPFSSNLSSRLPGPTNKEDTVCTALSRTLCSVDYRLLGRENVLAARGLLTLEKRSATPPYR
jgi:hypothetical protein